MKCIRLLTISLIYNIDLYFRKCFVRVLQTWNMSVGQKREQKTLELVDLFTKVERILVGST